MKTLQLLCFALLMGATSIAQDYLGTTTFGAGSIDLNYHSATDSNGAIYTAGLYSGSLTVGASTITWEGGNADGFLTKHDSDATPLWIKGFGGSMDNAAFDVAVDNDDNIFLTGYFQGAGSNSFDADPGPDEFLLANPSAIASRDCFIIKLDSNGDFVWAKQVSNPSGAAPVDSRSIEVDGDGNVYVAGRFLFADFDPSPSGDVTLFSTGSGSSFDGFLLKLDADGNFVYVKTFPSTGDVDISDMEFDANGDLLVAGSFEDTVDLDTGSGTDEFTSNGDEDVFMVKLTSDGDYIWGQTFGGTGIDFAEMIKSIDTSIYVGGMASNGADMDPGAGTDVIATAGPFDGFLSKFDTDGVYEFSYLVGGNDSSNFESVYSLRAGENDDLYLTGTFLSTTDFDYSTNDANSTSNGSTDNYLLKIDNAGNYIEHYTVGGDDTETNPQLEINSDMEIVFFGGFRSGTMNADPFGGTDNITNNGFFDVYFSRFFIEPTAGVEENALNEIVLYPNPSRDVLHISDIMNQLVAYEVYSLQGQLLISGDQTNSITVSELSSGTYLIKLQGATSSVTKRFIKL